MENMSGRPDEAETNPEEAETDDPTVILVIDDEEEIRSVLRLTLTPAGFDVHEVDGGRAALERLKELKPDLIILDLLMPEMNGIEVCLAVRANPETADIPILMYSAKTDTRSKQQGMEAGVTRYVTKPQVPEKLLQHISETLGPA